MVSRSPLASSHPGAVIALSTWCFLRPGNRLATKREVSYDVRHIKLNAVILNFIFKLQAKELITIFFT